MDVDAEVLRLRPAASEATIERVGRTRALVERGQVRPRPRGVERGPALRLPVYGFGLLPRVDGALRIVRVAAGAAEEADLVPHPPGGYP